MPIPRFVATVKSVIIVKEATATKAQYTDKPQPHDEHVPSPLAIHVGTNREGGNSFYNGIEGSYTSCESGFVPGDRKIEWKDYQDHAEPYARQEDRNV